MQLDDWFSAVHDRLRHGAVETDDIDATVIWYLGEIFSRAPSWAVNDNAPSVEPG